MPERYSRQQASRRTSAYLTPRSELPQDRHVRQNAKELEERLSLLKKRKIDKEDFDFFVENQRRDLRVSFDSQLAQAQERAEKLTLHFLGIAATKVVLILIAMI